MLSKETLERVKAIRVVKPAKLPANGTTDVVAKSGTLSHLKSRVVRLKTGRPNFDTRLLALKDLPPEQQLAKACEIMFRTPIQYCKAMQVAWAKSNLSLTFPTPKKKRSRKKV